MKKIILFLILILLFVNCNSNKTANTDKNTTETEQTTMPEWKKLKEETMAIHDSSMKYMGELKMLKKQLQEKIKSASGEEKQELQKTLEQVEKADKDMWDWMHNYKQPKEENITPDSLQKFFEEEKKKISIVDKQISEAIKNAKQLLNTNE